MTEREILDALRERHPAPAWAFLEHVGNGTGRNACRTADALAMSLWPSRGLELHGFEVKSARSDWLRELQDPAKADEIATRCHRWWIVAAEDGIVAQDDLFPQTWGLMVVREGALVVLREAPPLTPAPLSWEFLAAILRRTVEQYAAATRRKTRIERLSRQDTERFDPAKVRSRLERLSSTATKIHHEIASALYALDREDRKAKREAAGSRGGGGTTP